MALDFGAAVSDRVDHGSDASLDSLANMTLLMWIRPTTLTTNRKFWAKNPAGVSSTPHFSFDAVTSSELRVQQNQSTMNSEYVTNNASLTTNKWWFIGVTYTDGSSPRHRIFVGDLATIATERTYSVSTNGTGAKASDAADNWTIGNRNDNDLAFQGRIAWVGAWNVVLTAAQIQAQQFRPRPASSSVLFCWYGFNGTGTQANWAGIPANNGTVTGATVAPSVPIGPPFGFETAWHGAYFVPPPPGQPYLKRLGGVALAGRGSGNVHVWA